MANISIPHYQLTILFYTLDNLFCPGDTIYIDGLPLALVAPLC